MKVIQYSKYKTVSDSVNGMNKDRFSGIKPCISEACAGWDSRDGSSGKLSDHLILTEVNLLRVEEVKQLLLECVCWGDRINLTWIQSQWPLNFV